MNKATIDVDTSVNSATSTTIIDNPNADFIPTAPTHGNVSIASVEAYLRILLNTVISLTDTAIPNKDQNRAFKHLFRKALDQNFVHLRNLSYTRSDGSSTSSGYYGATPADYVIKPIS